MLINMAVSSIFTWRGIPSHPLPFLSPPLLPALFSPSLPLLPFHLPFPLTSPMIHLGSLGELCKFPGWSPTDKRFLAKLEHKIKHLIDVWLLRCDHGSSLITVKHWPWNTCNLLHNLTMQIQSCLTRKQYNTLKTANYYWQEIFSSVLSFQLICKFNQHDISPYPRLVTGMKPCLRASTPLFTTLVRRTYRTNYSASTPLFMTLVRRTYRTNYSNQLLSRTQTITQHTNLIDTYTTIK